MSMLLRRGISIGFVIATLFALYLTSLYNYLLFHSVAEIFSICIAFTVFLLAWNSVSYIKNNYLVVVGTAYLFIAILDLFHTLSFKGMQIFKDYDYYANQLWIAARYFESIILLLAFIYVKAKKQLNTFTLFTVFTAITILIMLSIFFWKVFPICFIDGVGLTPFKKYSEYIICMIILLAIIFLTKNKKEFDEKVYRYLLFSMLCTIISEVAFTFYINNYGFSNLIGHYFKIFSFYLIYRAIIVKGIQEPYNTIFRELKLNEQKLSEQNDLLRNQAVIDGLTGLYNHRFLYEYLDGEIKRCDRYKRDLCVIMLDIDYFKNINDTYGHLTGDIILKEISQIIKDNIRQTDIAGRYGGEEFLIILTETTIEQGILAAENIRKIIEKENFIHNIHITVSNGIKQFNGEKGSELVDKADKNLYIAKNSGRNKTVS